MWRVWWLPKYSSTCICSAMCIFFEGVAASPVQFYLYLLCAYSGGRDSFTITVLPVSAVCILWRVWWLLKYSSTCICSAVCIFFGGCGASQVQFYHLLCAFSGGCSSFTSWFLPVSTVCIFWRVWWLNKFISTCIYCGHFLEGVAASQVHFYLYLQCTFSGGCISFTCSFIPVSNVCIIWRVWWLHKLISICICSVRFLEGVSASQVHLYLYLLSAFSGGCGGFLVHFYLYLLCVFSGGCRSFTS